MASCEIGDSSSGSVLGERFHGRLRRKGGKAYRQAYARSHCDYERRMEMELEYAEHANLLWDIQILFATCKAVLSGSGAQ